MWILYDSQHGLQKGNIVPVEDISKITGPMDEPPYWLAEQQQQPRQRQDGILLTSTIYTMYKLHAREYTFRPIAM
jgi:hypothetical protein